MNRLDKIVEKYQLRGKNTEELQKVIGDSDRGCLTLAEYDFLRGDTFIDKALNLQTYLKNN